ncbi:MAG: Zn-dependent hydrolase [Thermodesulfobacteriota bacterium]
MRGRVQGPRGRRSGRRGMEVQALRIQKDIEVINSFNTTSERGITRLTFSKPYMAARSYVIEELRKIGAEIFDGAAGNVRGRLEGSDKGRPAVMMGSHIDTVFQGGRFDGVVGVVSALEAARVIVENGIAHRHPIDVVVFAEEEGARFQSILLGSRAWTGEVNLNDLVRFKDKEGVSYTDAMEQLGVPMAENSILCPDQIQAMLEVHIEQSVVLEKKGISVGVVEAIAGIKQFTVTLEGVANHAGGTPMNLRFDAMQGAARIISAVEEIASHEVSPNTVATVGVLECEPGQVNVIPGRVRFTIDVRDTDPGLIDKASKKVMAAITGTCQDRRLTCDITPRSDTPPVRLSKRIVRLIEGAAERKEVEVTRITSGALHDSSVMAEITEVGMIFVPSKGGRSHCPEEWTELKDIKLGADILLETVTDLAS